MLDSQIPMGGKPADTATPVYQAQQQSNANMAQSNSNALATEQILKQHYDALDAREKSRLSSSIVGATQLKQFLDRGDLPGAQSFLEQRRQMLHSRMANGENLDTQETDYALDALREGRVQELRNGVDGLIAAGQVYGIIRQPDNNPYLEQFKAVKAAHPQWTDAQVQDYVYTRGNVGKGTVFDQNGNVVNQPGAVAANATKAGAEKFAEGQGNKAGQQVIANNTALGNLSNLRSAVDAARQQVQRVAMSGPIFGRVGEAAKDVEYINLQRDLNEITLLAKELYNLGSGQGFTDADRDFLKELSGGAYNRAESVDYALMRFNDTLTKRENFLKTENARYQAQFGAGANQPPPQGVTPNGQKIRVSNGKETFMIDPADLPAAQNEGFNQQ